MIRAGILGLVLAMSSLQVAAEGAGFTRDWPQTDFGRVTIDLTEVISGGPPKDGIPALSDPTFVQPPKRRGWSRASRC